jgi:transposase InsO family protein
LGAVSVWCPSARGGKTWIFGVVDDHSRYVLGLRIATTRRSRRSITDNGGDFVHWMPGVLNRFGKTLRELEIRQIKTQVDSPWTNGKIEAFWATLKGEVLDRQVLRSLADAEAALERFARSYYHRLQGEIGWLTPASATTARRSPTAAFANVPALAHLEDWLDEIRTAA